MRKDVKLGFAIGGVLLAVLIVYVLVVPGGGDKRLSSATGGDASQTGGAGAGAGGGGVSLVPVTPSPATQPAPGAGGATAAAGTPPAAPPANFTPAGGATDPFEQPEPVANNSNSSNNTTAKAKDVDWSKLLNDSDMLMVQTPSKPIVSAPPPPSSAAESKPADAQQLAAGATPDITKPGPTPVTPPAPPAAQPQQVETAQATTNGNSAPESTPPAPPARPAPTVVDAPTPMPAEQAPPVADSTTTTTTPPTASGADGAANAGEKIHVVQSGETFSTISMIAYGNPNLYSAIMRANPGIDPVKLRPGMKVVIPPLSEARPAPAPAPAAPPAAAPVAAPPARVIGGDTAQVASTKAEAPIDPQTQYRVQPGDNLYSISKKLYGRGDRYLRIHEANKQTLGDDANSLKAGQILTLPEPPTAK